MHLETSSGKWRQFCLRSQCVNRWQLLEQLVTKISSIWHFQLSLFPSPCFEQNIESRFRDFIHLQGTRIKWPWWRYLFQEHFCEWNFPNFYRISIKYYFMCPHCPVHNEWTLHEIMVLFDTENVACRFLTHWWCPLNASPEEELKSTG